MAFEPDIIVTGIDSPEIALVAEVKRHIRDFEATERQLRKYMVDMRCPVGLLVTPQRLWLYRDRYIASSPDSIERVGEFDSSNLFALQSPGPDPSAGLALEVAFQSWLEDLGAGRGLRGLPADIRSAVQKYVVPAVSQGAIRAGHPRSTLTA